MRASRIRPYLVVFGVLGMLSSASGQPLDCHKTESHRRRACNVKVLGELGRVKTSETAGARDSHDSVGTQQGRQEILRGRIMAGNRPAWPPFRPLRPDDPETTALLTSEWEGWRTDLTGTGARRFTYKIDQVTGADVQGKLGETAVDARLTGRALVFSDESTDDLPSTFVFERIDLEEIRGAIFVTRWDGVEIPLGLVWLTKRFTMPKEPSVRP